MLKFTVVYLALFTVVSCRNDAKLAAKSIPNPCGETSNNFCSFPNPVKDSVSIFITTPGYGKIEMTYYDKYANELAKILDSSVIEGDHLFVFDTEILPTGLNICMIKMFGETYLAKIIKV